MNCLFCGKEVVQTPGRRPRQYCDDNCRQKKWQADHKKPSEPKREIIEPFNPDNLQKEFDEVFGSPTRKTFQDYLKEASVTQHPGAFRKMIKEDKSLTPNQRSAIYARIKK